MDYDDDLGNVYVWTCEIGGHTEESYEQGRPPEGSHWDVIDLERRFGSCDDHLPDDDGGFVGDDGQRLPVVDVDGKRVGWSGRSQDSE